MLFIYINMKRVDKSRSIKFTVNSIRDLTSFIRVSRIGFNGYSYLWFIVNRYLKSGEYSTYNSVYTFFYPKPSGNVFRVMKGCIHTLERKGFIVIDRSEYVCRLYPTDKALKEVSKFL